MKQISNMFTGSLNRITFFKRLIVSSLLTYILGFMLFAILVHYSETGSYIFITAAIIINTVYFVSLVKRRLKDVFPNSNSVMSTGIYFIIATLIPFSSLLLIFLPSDVLSKYKRVE